MEKNTINQSGGPRENSTEILNLKLERLTSKDWNAYKKIRIKSLNESDETFGSTAESELELQDSYWQDLLSNEKSEVYENFKIYGLRVGDRIAATISIGLEKDEGKGLHCNYNGMRPTIDRVYVRPEYRDKKLGLGKKILADLIDIIKSETDYPYVCLDVYEDNDSLIGFYAKSGFELTGSSDDVTTEDKTWKYLEMMLELK